MQKLCRPGLRGENAELVLPRMGVKQGRYEGNAADLALAGDAWRECRISVGHGCGERVRNLGCHGWQPIKDGMKEMLQP
jgi:hypothetical protein